MFLEVVANLNLGNYTSNYSADDILFGGAFAAAIAGILVFLIFLSIALYIYSSFAYMHIGKKAKVHAPGIAWIPAIGPLLVAFKSSKMNSWPWWLLLSFLLVFIPNVGPFLAFIGFAIFWVYAIAWHWKMFESIKMSGWYAILMLIPIVNLIILGIAAWSKH